MSSAWAAQASNTLNASHDVFQMMNSSYSFNQPGFGIMIRIGVTGTNGTHRTSSLGILNLLGATYRGLTKGVNLQPRKAVILAPLLSA